MGSKIDIHDSTLRISRVFDECRRPLIDTAGPLNRLHLARGICQLALSEQVPRAANRRLGYENETNWIFCPSFGTSVCLLRGPPQKKRTRKVKAVVLVFPSNQQGTLESGLCVVWEAQDQPTRGRGTCRAPGPGSLARLPRKAWALPLVQENPGEVDTTIRTLSQGMGSLSMAHMWR